MNQGGDRGKAPNITGTQPRHKKEQTLQQPQKPDQGRKGQGSASTSKPSPKKVTARTTKKSRDK
jgi:hypothetical protein